MVVEDDNPPPRECYACPVCGAVPGALRLVIIHSGGNPGHSPRSAEQRTVLRFLADGPTNSPRARAIAALATQKHNAAGRDAGANVKEDAMQIEMRP